MRSTSLSDPLRLDVTDSIDLEATVAGRRGGARNQLPVVGRRWHEVRLLKRDPPARRRLPGLDVLCGRCRQDNRLRHRLEVSPVGVVVARLVARTVVRATVDVEVGGVGDGRLDVAVARRTVTEGVLGQTRPPTTAPQVRVQAVHPVVWHLQARTRSEVSTY